MSTSQPNAISHWWQALQAVPFRKNARAPHTPDDHRTSPYDRLWRVWADPTSTSDGPHRPRTERHLTWAIIENFVLFPPKLWIPALLGQPPVASAEIADAQWSYEYEQPVEGSTKGERLADWVVHFRSAAGDFILVAEAKNVGKDLGPPVDRNGKPNKNLDPSYYLEMREFGFVPRASRRMVYLVDDAVVAKVKNQLLRCPADSYRILTWQKIVGIQVNLALTTTPAPINAWLAGFIVAHANDLGIRVSIPGVEAMTCQHNGSVWRFGAPSSAASLGVVCSDPEGEDLASHDKSLVVWAKPGGPMNSLRQLFPETADYVLAFLAGCMQYRMYQDGHPPPCPAFPYLASEESFLAMHKARSQSTPDRQQTLWRLPS